MLDFIPSSLIVHSSLSPVFCLKIATLSLPGLDSLQLFPPVGSFAPELLNCMRLSRLTRKLLRKMASSKRVFLWYH